MLHQGQVVLDVSGDERRGMDVPDLLRNVRTRARGKSCRTTRCCWVEAAPG